MEIILKYHQYPLEFLKQQAEKRAFDISNEFTSENTRRAYAGDLNYWQTWLAAVGHDFNEPVSLKEVVMFIIQHIEGIDPLIAEQLKNSNFNKQKYKFSTIKRRLASLSMFLNSIKAPNPCNDNEVKRLLIKLSKLYGNDVSRGRAITRDILEDILATCSNDTLIGIRDKAVLLFAWGTGGRRQSEVVKAQIKDLTALPFGEYIYTIPKSKTDQEGKGYQVPVKGRVAKALNDWLTVSKITKGYIFRSLKYRRFTGYKILPDSFLYCMVKRRVKMAGYNPDEFRAHSLRSGFVTEAGRQRKPIGDVMQMTAHKTFSTVMKYYQVGDIINNSSSNLAD